MAISLKKEHMNRYLKQVAYMLIYTIVNLDERKSHKKNGFCLYKQNSFYMIKNEVNYSSLLIFLSNFANWFFAKSRPPIPNDRANAIINPPKITKKAMFTMLVAKCN